jgi:hypothetical protein
MSVFFINNNSKGNNMSNKKYTIQTTIYKNGELIESTTVSYPIKFENKHKLVDVIHLMIKGKRRK